MADLTTIANLEERLAITGTNPTDVPDAYLENLIDRATDLIESVVGRDLDSQAFTEYYSGDGTHILQLRQGPISTSTAPTVSSVTYDSTGSESLTALTENVDYFVWGKEATWRLPGWLENSTHWTAGRRNYKVVYTAGFGTIPEDLEEAALHACVWMKNKRHDAATKSREVADGALDGFQNLSELVKDLRMMLQPYISRAFF